MAEEYKELVCLIDYPSSCVACWLRRDRRSARQRHRYALQTASLTCKAHGAGRQLHPSNGLRSSPARNSLPNRKRPSTKRTSSNALIWTGVTAQPKPTSAAPTTISGGI